MKEIPTYIQQKLKYSKETITVNIESITDTMSDEDIQKLFLALWKHDAIDTEFLASHESIMTDIVSTFLLHHPVSQDVASQADLYFEDTDVDDFLLFWYDTLQDYLKLLQAKNWLALTPQEILQHCNIKL